MTQKRKAVKSVQTSLQGIANRAKKSKKARFGNLYGLLNEELLRDSFYKLKRKAAAGVDGIEFADYEANLDANLTDLVERLKGKQYRARLVRRKMIPKGGGKLRALGIPVLEDKLVQHATARILSAIYEEDFLDVSWGYRPHRSARQASLELEKSLFRGRFHWVVEADIRGFFDNIDHDWMIKMLGERIDDAPFVRLIGKWLKAGILEEDGKVIDPLSGTPQGGIISPVLANIYLHYALDLWFEHRVSRQSLGQVYLIRYADDFVCAFESHKEAEAFMGQLKERLKKFSLELAEDKTKLIHFSRHNVAESSQFSFLGFEYRWIFSRRGKATIRQRTDRQRLRRSVANMTEWFRKNRHQRTSKVMKTLKLKLQGYWNYYGVRGNSRSLDVFWEQTKRVGLKWLNRRSGRRSYTWEGFAECLEHFGIFGPRGACLRDQKRGEQLQLNLTQ